MPFLNFIKKCYDKNTLEQYRRGEVLEFSDERADEIKSAGVAKEIGGGGGGGTSNLETVLTNGNTSSKSIILNHSTGVTAKITGGGIQITPDPTKVYADKASLTSVNGLMLDFKEGDDNFYAKLTSDSFYMGGKKASDTEYEHFEFSPSSKKVTFTSGLAEAFKAALGLSNVTLQDVFRNSLNEYGHSSCYVDKHGTFFFNFYDGLCLNIDSRNEEVKMDSLSTENTISSVFTPGKISLVTSDSAVDYGYATEANSFEVDTANGIVTLSPGIASKFKEALDINSGIETMIQGWTNIKANTYSRLDISQAIAEGKKRFTILVYARKDSNRQAIKLELTLTELNKILSKAQQNELTIIRSCAGFTNANDIALCKQTVKQVYDNGVALEGVLDIKYQLYEGGQAVTGLDNFEYCIYAE